MTMSTDAQYCHSCENTTHAGDLERIDGCDGPVDACPYCGATELVDAYQCEDCQGYFPEALLEQGQCFKCVEIADDPGAAQGHP